METVRKLPPFNAVIKHIKNAIKQLPFVPFSEPRVLTKVLYCLSFRVRQIRSKFLSHGVHEHKLEHYNFENALLTAYAGSRRESARAIRDRMADPKGCARCQLAGLRASTAAILAR